MYFEHVSMLMLAFGITVYSLSKLLETRDQAQTANKSFKKILTNVEIRLHHTQRRNFTDVLLSNLRHAHTKTFENKGVSHTTGYYYDYPVRAMHHASCASCTDITFLSISQ